MKELYQRFNIWLSWVQYDSDLRIETYNALTLLLDNQVQLNKAILMLLNVYTGERVEKNHPIALALKSALAALEKGFTFAEGMKEWVPEEEFRLLYAGELSGQLTSSFKETSSLIRAKSEVTSSIISGLAYPSILCLLSGGLLYMVSSQVVPKFAQVVDPKKWTGSSVLLYKLSSFTTHYGLLLIVGLFACVIFSLLSFPRWTGRLRVIADRYPPWSIYRMVHGSSFLLNLSSLLHAGRQLDHALSELLKGATPWMKERLVAIRQGLAKGYSFGEALEKSPYEFPDVKNNRFLAVISEYSGLDKAMKEVSENWLKDGLKNINYTCNLLSVAGLAFVGAIMILVVVGAGNLQEVVQSSSNV